VLKFLVHAYPVLADRCSRRSTARAVALQAECAWFAEAVADTLNRRPADMGSSQPGSNAFVDFAPFIAHACESMLTRILVRDQFFRSFSSLESEPCFESDLICVLLVFTGANVNRIRKRKRREYRP
jgi:hypothetical protein